MSTPWTAERNVTLELAQTLIATQFPGLAGQPISRQGLGWDNVVYRVGDSAYFRFPIRADADAGVAREIEWLPRLEAAGLPVPRLRHIGAPSSPFPWSFFGYEPVSGVEAGELGLSIEERARLARPLAAVLRRLHSESLFGEATARGLAIDPIGRLDLKKRARMTRERLAELRATGSTFNDAPWLEALARSELLPRPPATAFVHGDLHFRHVILGSDRSFSGLIDWGDLHLNHPAVDLQLVYSLLPPQARPAFWNEYGATQTESERVITQAFAVFLNVALLFYATRERLDGIRAEAERALSWITVAS